MSIPKKGSRCVAVGKVEYRWRVRSRPTYCQALGWSPLTLAVEQANSRGSVLVVDLPLPHPSNWMQIPSSGVTPAVVAALIRQALKAGWQPQVRGPQFRFEAKVPTVG